MKFLETSKLFSLNKSTYVNLRWIAYIGQLIAILVVEFFFKFKFNYFLCISIILFSVSTNIYLKFFIKDNQINNSKELKKIRKDSKDFKKIYDNEKSKLSIQRFKGLGEMNPEELWETTLNPETRNLLKVEYSKNIKKDQEIIHTLMGNDVASRKDFIVSNAINVSNLDI